MEWMLPWVIGLGIFSWIAAMTLMGIGGVPAPIQVLGVVTLLAFTVLVARKNRQPEDAPEVERIR